MVINDLLGIWIDWRVGAIICRRNGPLMVVNKETEMNRHYSTLQGIISETQQQHGGTWSISFGPQGRIMAEANPFDSGYYVATENSLIVHRELTQEMLAGFIRESAHELTVGSPRLFLGTWTHEGRTHIELTQHVNNLDIALTLAVENGQESIWDISNAKEIPITDALRDVYRAA